MSDFPEDRLTIDNQATEKSALVQPRVNRGGKSLIRNWCFRQFDRLDTGLWIFDFDHKRILWANRKALEITDSATP